VDVDDDGLDLLAAHDGADTAARREARWPPVGIGKRDARDKAEILPDRSAQREADLLTVFPEQELGDFVIALAEVGAALSR
jgi:hypothetical protein